MIDNLVPIKEIPAYFRRALKRMEVIAWTIFLLVLVAMIVGACVYAYRLVLRKGFFTPKANYYTALSTASGLAEGNPVLLFGFVAGEITHIEPAPAETAQFNVMVEFAIKWPYYQYLKTDSRVKVSASDLLGSRVLEVSKGVEGQPTYLFEDQKTTAIWRAGKYEPVTLNTRYWIIADEETSFADRLIELVDDVRGSLPGLFALTNQMSMVLANTADATSNINVVLMDLQPVTKQLATQTAEGQAALAKLLLSSNVHANLEGLLLQSQVSAHNLGLITAQLTNANGSMGNWLMPSNLNLELALTLANVRGNLSGMTTNLVPTLIGLAQITSNLSHQVQASSNLMSEMSSAVINADKIFRGLQKHWFIKSAFKEPGKDTPEKAPEK